MNNTIATNNRRVLGPNIWKESTHQLTLDLIEQTKEIQRQRILLREEDKRVKDFEINQIIEEFAMNGIILHQGIYTSKYDDSCIFMQYSLIHQDVRDPNIPNPYSLSRKNDELSPAQHELMEKSKLVLKRYRTTNFTYCKRDVITGNCDEGYYFV